MRIFLGKQDMCSLPRAQEHCFLLTNGLGGYASVTAAYSVNRCDQGILVAAVKAPNERIIMVHRMRETLNVGGQEVFLSTQDFAGNRKCEDGCRHLNLFSYDGTPVWQYQVEGIGVRRSLAVGYETNTAALTYEIENHTAQACTLDLDPFLKFAPKEQALREKKRFSLSQNRICAEGHTLYVHTDGNLTKRPVCWQTLAYPEDAKDGRPAKGMAACCCRISKTVQPGETARFEVVFSLEKKAASAEDILQKQRDRLNAVEESCGFEDPIAKALAVAADAYIARRDSTGCKTILAGYPLFSDWGRDTMIALPGCCLATKRYDDAKSILRTFLAYEQDGLVPNLFPEGGHDPMYNTVDAALLLIDAVWQYWNKTGDAAFVQEAWPVMERIIAAYRRGTHHHIGMDTDGLIYAGGGLDQVTWMDVCVNGVLPTPRHGKPVEINAYWYNALRIMDALAKQLGREAKDYAALAETVKASFIEKFYMPDKGYLRDVLSGTSADEQLRCNQIWAVSMAFSMLEGEQANQVVDTVYRHLYTPCGLRTLSPEDPEYHGSYGGDQFKRDMAYHQGTTWVFPMGGYYLAYLKVNGYSPEAVSRVRQQLQALEPMLRQGCIGQLPEIYDGQFPSEGKGCFAQAWSVGEMLRVFEAIEQK